MIAPHRLTPLLLTLAGLPFGTGARAQQSEPVELEARGRGSFQFGYLDLDVEAINGSLDAAGLPGFDSGVLTLGGAGYGAKGPVLIGGEGHAILGGKKTTSDGAFEVSLGGGYGLFRLGYLVVETEAFDLYPRLGIGGGRVSVNVKGRSAPLFDDVLQDPGRSSALTSGMFLLDFGLGADYRFRIESDEDEFGGLLIGLQAGYLLAPGSPTWTLDGINSVAGGPELLIQGLYIRVSIGGWGVDRGEDDEG